MTQQEFNEKVRLLEDQIKKSQAVLEELKAVKIENNQQKRWRPIYDNRYWVVDCNGDITRKHWHDDIYDNWRYLIGNCFETRKETETCKKKIEYTAIYKNYVEKHSEPLDWKNRNQQKYNACYNTNDEEICVESSAYACCQGTIYASSEEIIWDAINSIREDNFKRYVLGVL